MVLSVEHARWPGRRWGRFAAGHSQSRVSEQRCIAGRTGVAITGTMHQFTSETVIAAGFQRESVSPTVEPTDARKRTALAAG